MELENFALHPYNVSNGLPLTTVGLSRIFVLYYLDFHSHQRKDVYL